MKVTPAVVVSPYAYKDYDISFNLLNVTWNMNAKWAVGEKDDDTEMKKSLRQVSYRVLNLYFQTDLTSGVLGQCFLLSNVANGKSDPTVYFSDGCNVNANIMSGRSYRRVQFREDGCP